MGPKKKMTVSPLEPEDKCQLVKLENNADYLAFCETNPTGLLMISEQYGEPAQMVMKADAGDFAKWLKERAPVVKVEIEKADRRLYLCSGDYWLPLVFLASNIGLPLYLNLVANYLYDKIKGALRGDRTRVHLSAVYKDAAKGIVKQFIFEGDADALQRAIKRLDLDEFFNE